MEPHRNFSARLIWYRPIGYRLTTDRQSSRQAWLRPASVFSLAAYALCLFSASYWVQSLWSYYLLSIVTALVAIGSSPVTFTRVINGWFNTSRCLALGILLMGTGLVAALAPPLLSGFVEEFGWRSGYRALAVVVALATVVVWLFIKEDPENTCQEGDESVSVIKFKHGMAFKDTIKAPIFIVLRIVFILVALAVSGAIIHFIPMLLDLGVSASKAGGVAAIIGVFGAWIRHLSSRR